MIPNYTPPSYKVRQLWDAPTVTIADRQSAIIVGPQYIGQDYTLGVGEKSILELNPFSDSNPFKFFPFSGVTATGDVDTDFLKVYGNALKAEVLYQASAAFVNNGVLTGVAANPAAFVENGVEVKANTLHFNPIAANKVRVSYFHFGALLAANTDLIPGALYANVASDFVLLGEDEENIPAKNLFVANVDDAALAEDSLSLVETRSVVCAGSGLDAIFSGRDVRVGDSILFIDSEEGAVAYSRRVIALENKRSNGTELNDTPPSIVQLVTPGADDGATVDSTLSTANPYYTGEHTTRLIIEIVSGGPYSSAWTLRVSDDRGLIEPYLVSKVANATFADIGFNIRLKNFDVTGTGSVWALDVTAGAAIDGVYDTLVLDSPIVKEGAFFPAITTDTRKGAAQYRIGGGYVAYDFTGEIPEISPNNPDNVSYSLDTNSAGDVGVIIKATGDLDDSIYVPDEDLTAGYAPIIGGYGKFGVAWRSIVSPAEHEAPVAVDATNVTEELGAPFSGNILRNAVDAALSGSGGKAVYALRAPGDDVEAYTSALERIESNDSAMFLSATSLSGAVREAVTAHCEAMSQESVRNWRRAYQGVDTPAAFAVLANKSNGTPYQMTISSTGGIYRLVTCADALFTSYSIRAGDTIRYNFVTLSDGSSTYAEYVIEKVLSDTQLLLQAGPGVAVSATRFEVWKPNSALNMVDYLTNAAVALSSERTMLVWTEGLRVDANGAYQVVDNRYLAAFVAGRRSALPAPQGLTNQDVGAYVNRCPLLYTKYKLGHLNSIAAAGVCIVTQDSPTVTPYIRHQLTTQTEQGPLQYEDSVGVRYDTVLYMVKDRFAGYIGKNDASKITLGEVHRMLTDELTKAANDPVNEFAPLIAFFRKDKTANDGTVDVRMHPVNRSTFVTNAVLGIPLPLNEILFVFLAVQI